MPDTPPDGEPGQQTPPAGQPAGTPPAGQPPAGGAPDPGNADPYAGLTVEELAAKLKVANNEAKTRRERIETLEAAEAKRQQEGETETQTLTRERDDLKAEVATLKGQLADVGMASDITAAASAMRFRNPAIAQGLLKVAGADITDDGGALDKAKLKVALATLVKENDYLVETGGGDGGEGRGTGGGRARSMNDAIRRAAGKD